MVEIHHPPGQVRDSLNVLPVRTSLGRWLLRGGILGKAEMTQKLREYIEYAYKYNEAFLGRPNDDFFHDFVLERVWVTLHPENYDKAYIEHILSRVSYPSLDKDSA